MCDLFRNLQQTNHLTSNLRRLVSDMTAFVLVNNLSKQSMKPKII